MIQYSEEQLDFHEDCAEKKNVAAAARYRRGKCGKSGKVKFVTDYMTAKERKSLNGEVKVYRLNSPMSWGEFNAMPDDLKGSYIKLLRKKYNVPDKEVAAMMGVDVDILSDCFKQLKLNKGNYSNGDITFNAVEWTNWLTRKERAANGNN